MRMSTYLIHHGIKGMKWGVKNGPPYPIGEDGHSASEKRAGWRKSLRSNPSQKKRNASSQRSPQQIADYRKKMVERCLKKGYKDVAEEYRNASEEELAKEMVNKEKIKKALLITAGVVGVGAAIYIVARRQQTIAVASALDPKATVSSLLDNGISIDVANKILQIRGNSNGLLDDNQIREIVDAANKDFDIVLGPDVKFARVDFRKDFDPKKAGNLLYVAIGETDNKKYGAFLPNRQTDDILADPTNYFLKANSEIKIPGFKKANSMLEKMYAHDKSFRNEVFSALDNIIAGQKRTNPLMPDYSAQELFDQLKDLGGVGYAVNTALVGSPRLSSMAGAMFKSKGYNAIIDTHDVVDRVSKFPVIGLGSSIFTITGKEQVDRLALQDEMMHKVMASLFGKG